MTTLFRSGCLLLSCLLACPLLAQPVPSLIIHNARITTLDDARPQAEAIALTGKTVQAVGSSADMLALKGPQTKVIDAKGRTLVPGLYDDHLHIIREGRFYNTELRWDGLTSLKRGLEMLREQAKRTPPGQWIKVVGGWTEYQFDENRLPTLKEINEAAPNTPVYILHLYSKALMNRAALKACGITTDTPNPASGLIERDDKGQPTGLLVAEPAATLLYYYMSLAPALSVADQVNSTKMFMQEMNRLGVTGALDAGGGFQAFPDDYGIADSLSKLGELTVRVPHYLFAQKGGREFDDYKKWVAAVNVERDPEDYYVDGAGENIVMTGADWEDFEKPRPDLLPVMEDQLKPILMMVVGKNWPFRLHATYDETITRFLNVIEEVHKALPNNKLSFIIDHAETIQEPNLQRIKALGGGIAVQGRMAFQGENFIIRYGRKRAENSPPIKRMLELGIPVGMGTDGTRVASYNPWVTMRWLVTGLTTAGVGTLAPQNRLDRLTALKLYTVGTASLVGEDDHIGRLKPGYTANLTLLSDDYFAMPADKINTLEALFTVFEGKPVWGQREFAKDAPAQLTASPAWSPVNYYGGYQKRLDYDGAKANRITRAEKAPKSKGDKRTVASR